MHPGVSIASVALARGLNANMLRRWVHDAEQLRPSSGRRGVEGCDGVAPKAVTAAPSCGFVQLPMPVQPAPAVPPQATATSPPPEHVTNDASSIVVEIQRSQTSVHITWPTSAAAHAAAWLREVLR